MNGVNLKSLLWVGPASGFASALINASLFGLYNSMGVSLNTLVTPDMHTMNYMVVIFASLVPSIIGSVFLAILGKFAKNPFKLFGIIGSVLVVLSFLNPLMLEGISVGQIISLNSLHIVVFAVLWLMVNKFARS